MDVFTAYGMIIGVETADYAGHRLGKASVEERFSVVRKQAVELHYRGRDDNVRCVAADIFE